MLSAETIAKLLEHGLAQGADFAEVFVEDSLSSSFNLLDRKIDQINSANSFGVGIRLFYGNESYYGYSSDPAEKTLLQLTKNLGQSGKSGEPGSQKPLARQAVEDIHHVAINPETVADRERVELLRRLDEQTRKHGSDIRQVNANMNEKRRSVLISNSEGLLVEDSRD